MKLSSFNLLDDEDDQGKDELTTLLDSFNHTSARFPDKTITQLFEEIADNHPTRTALVFGDQSVSYQELDEKANQYAHFLLKKGVITGSIVGLMFNKSLEMIYAMLGCIKAGATYLPMDPDYPAERLKFTINDSGLKIIVSAKKFIRKLNKLQWECPNLLSFVCVDSDNVLQEEEDQNEMMKKELWDFIGEKSHDDISGGAWFSSYTGEDLPREDMDEYAENIYQKVFPFLNKETKVLEIGCSSGISMFRIAPQIKSYYGTDLSSQILAKTEEKRKKLGIDNITLQVLPAHEIDQVEDSGFDIVIINSVIQLFNGHNYLRDVLNKAIHLMSDRGILFLGDLQDQDRKEALIDSLKTFQREHVGKGYTTKTDWTNELFISKNFLNDLRFENPAIQQAEFSEKIHTIKNELTEFRYDSILTVDKTVRSTVYPEDKNRFQFNGYEISSCPVTRPLVSLSPEDALYVIYTSGSTGRPKGCIISHKNVVRLMLNDKHDFDFGKDDVWVMAHAYYFDFSVWEMYGALLYGGKLIVPTKSEVQDISGLLKLIRKHKISVLNQTPLAFNFLIQEELNEPHHNLDEHLRYVVFGGDKLDPQKLIPWVNLYHLEKVKLINMYGITETTVHVTYYQITPEDLANKGVSPIGRPIPETTIYILNDHQKPVPIGIAGEMYVGGTGVCKGYLNRNALTRERFIDNPVKPGELLYQTGDLARWLDNGNLEYHGRKDFQVKIRGYRIELGEIESILNSYSKIKESVVIAFDKEGQNELVGYFVPNSGEENPDVQELREFMALDLPDFMIPAHFVVIDQIPLTVNGKLDKKALPDPYKSGMGSGTAFVAPENEVQKTVCSVWQEVLGIAQVGINDNFFSIGGDSLKAIRVVVLLNKKLDASVKVSHIFSYQTVAQLSMQVEEINREAGSNDWQTGMDTITRLQKAILSTDSELISSEIDSIYPLTSIEKGMIFSSMLRTDEPVYYDQFTYNLTINSTEIFEHAFYLMVQKHPILRSKYYMKRYMEPLKIVLKDMELPLEFEDISGETPSVQQNIINTYLKKDSDARLSFNGDLLWHLKAFLIKENQFYIVWTVHHAILDGWSESSFVMEFANLCGNPEVMQLTELAPLKASYMDYCAINIGKELSGKSVDYWKKLLSGHTRNKLPFNLSGKKIAEAKGMLRVGKFFGDALGQDLELLRHELGVTYKSICLAAYAYLMHIICSESDVVSGVVSNDRPEIEDGDKILGCFLNTIPFRIEFENIRTYGELIQHFNDFLTQVKQHEIYLVDIAEAAGQKSSSENPLFDCIFNFTDFHIMDDLSDQNDALGFTSGAAKSFDIAQNNLMTNTLFDLEVDKTGGYLTVGIKYSLAYFDANDVNYALELYEKILHVFVSDVSRELNASDLLDEADKQALLYDFNDTLTPYSEHKLMHQLFEERAAQQPQEIALIQDGKKLTYKELDEKANQIAQLLVKKGLQNGDNVGIICDRNFTMIEGLLGILKSGGAYVPIDPGYPKDRQEYILNNSNARLILTDQEYEITRSPEKSFIDLSCTDFTGISSQPILLQKDSQDLAYTIYTSGSTGRPKGVMIEHHSAVNLIEWVNKTFSVRSDDRLLFITSMCFDLSVYDIFGILAAGGKIVIAQQEQVKDPELLQHLMIREKITFWDSVPTTMNYLVDMIESSGNGYQQLDLRLVFMSGDWIPVNLAGRINQYFPNAKNISLGGATEGTVWSNYYPITGVQKGQISIPYGKPIDNNFFYILDDHRNPVPRGVAGELYIGGYGVAAGYANDPEKTDAAFFDDPFANIPNARMYKTGDLGRMMPDGNMEFLGRKDFQVKIRGFRVELGEVENQLQRIPEVKRAVVLAKEDNRNSKYLCAYVVLEHEISNEVLKAQLQKELPEYMIPGIFVRIDQIPITSNGKIDRKALPDPGSQWQEKSFMAPKPGLESDLAAIWQGILGIDKIGSDENVFEMGAHSLHAGAFVSRVAKSLGYEINLRDLFVHPTIGALAKVMESGQGTISTHIPKAEDKPYYALSYGQQNIWTIHRMQGGSPEWNISYAYQIDGVLDENRMNTALNRIAERHESLRTTFPEVDGVPVQKIAPAVSYRCEMVDLKGQTLSKEDIRQILLKNVSTSFDLEKGPLLRVVVLQIEQHRNVVLLLMHHIISDGWSMNNLFNELFGVYYALSNNLKVDLPDLPIQYKDYSEWQRNLVENHSSKDRKFWMDKLGNTQHVSALPYDFERPARSTRGGDNVYALIDSEQLAQIDAFCIGQNISSYMFITGVINLVLGKHTGSNEILLGGADAGRNHTHQDNLIGYFLNFFPIYSTINVTHSITDFFAAFRETMVEAFQHKYYPYFQLLKDLNIQRQPNQNPLFDVMVVKQNVEHEAEPESAPQDFDQGWKMEKVAIGYGASKFDLAFKIFEGNELIINLEYDTDLFVRETVQKIMDDLIKMTNIILSEPNISLTELMK